MSLTASNKVDTNKYELSIHVDPETLEKAVEAAYRKQIKNINVPGFRRGKAPRKMVEKLYGEGVFYDEAINALYPQALEDAVKEAGLELVARPDVEVKEIGKDKGVDMVATCVVKPEVSIKDYKGIEVEKHVHTVAEEDIDKRLDMMRNRNARLIDAGDRASKEGDTLTFDFDGYVDNQPFDGGKAEKFSLEIGSKQFIPGFEEQLLDRKVDDEFEVNVTFPEDYHAEELKGKPAVFKCKVHEIKTKELPELDDEFAKDVSEFDTLEDLKADIRRQMQEQADKTADQEFESQLFDKVVANMEAEIPHEMIDGRVEDMVREFQYRLQSQGLNLETYLQYTGMTPDTFRATYHDQAEKDVKLRLALEKIVELEKIVPTEEEIEEEFKKAADNYQMDVEKFKQLVPQKDFVEDLSVNKAVALVKDTAKITEVAEEKTAKPKKTKKASKSEE